MNNTVKLISRASKKFWVLLPRVFAGCSQQRAAVERIIAAITIVSSQTLAQAFRHQFTIASSISPSINARRDCRLPQASSRSCSSSRSSVASLACTSSASRAAELAESVDSNIDGSRPSGTPTVDARESGGCASSASLASGLSLEPKCSGLTWRTPEAPSDLDAIAGCRGCALRVTLRHGVWTAGVTLYTPCKTWPREALHAPPTRHHCTVQPASTQRPPSHRGGGRHSTPSY